MGNENKIILDLCGGTGAWSEPYKSAGYEVHVITLPKWDVVNFTVDRHNGELVFHSLENTKLIYMNKIHGILAAPPCTEFSLAKNNKQRNLYSGIKAVGSCMQIIWLVRAYKKIAFWALENPRGLLRQFLGAPAFTFEHWQFGEETIKPTDLWGYFNLPKPTVKERPVSLTKTFHNGRINSKTWATPVCPPQYGHLRLSRADLRAITSKGFAEAFYRANK